MAHSNVGQMANSTVWPREEGAVYHELETPWALWYDTKLGRHRAHPNQFFSNLHKIGSFDTLEHFWKLYLYIKRPSSLDVNSNIYLFRDGAHIAPMWGKLIQTLYLYVTDMFLECFPNGGCWILKIRKRGDMEASVLGKMWQDLVFAVIGEAFEEPDVVGVSVSIRAKEDLLTVWNADNRNDEIRFRIGEKLKEILELEPSTVIEYKYNANSIADSSSFKNAKAYVFTPAEGSKN